MFLAISLDSKYLSTLISVMCTLHFMQNTIVPATKTTYWCHVVQLPQEEDRYIYKV